MKSILILSMLAFFPLQATQDDDIQRIHQDIMHLESSIADLDSKVELLAFSMMEFYSSFLLEEPEEYFDEEFNAASRCDCDD